MLRSLWYRLIFTSVLLIPALVCQTIFPIVSQERWEMLSESLYSLLLFWQNTEETKDSKVAIIEIDQQTLDAYGWPIDRSYYVKTLSKLKESGHPWLLSLMSFQALDKIKADSKAQEARATQDAALEQAIAGYQRYIGTGLEIVKGEELSIHQEEVLLPRVLLSKIDMTTDDLPSLPLFFKEDERFVNPQQAFGFGARFGLAPVIRCMPTMLTDLDYSGKFVIPSSLIWAAAYGTESSIRTTSGASWPRKGENQPFSPKHRLKVALKHCLTAPSVLTQDFLKARGIERVSLIDFLDSKREFQLAGKTVLLAPNGMKLYKGPGQVTDQDDGVVAEYLLVARFLDELMTGNSILRDSHTRDPMFQWLPIVLTACLVALSFFLAPVGVIMISLAAFVGLIGYSSFHLVNNTFIIPIQAITSMACTSVGLLALAAYLLYHGVRRQVRFAHHLTEKLSQCNTIFDIEKRAFEVSRDEFQNVTLQFAGFDRAFYEASNNPNAAMKLIDHQRANIIKIEGSGPSDAQSKNVTYKKGLLRLPFQSQGIEITLPVESELGRLGTIKLNLRCQPHEEGYIANLLDILRIEVSQHWHRIKILADQKLLDYRYLMEQTRGDIMERFLTHALVSKFSDNRTMNENLKAVLTPRPARTALMQADIRGYSKMAAKLGPLDMVKILQGYYKNVVDAAQMVAQVKLIGDCIFLFIEDEAAKDGATPADLALNLAAILVRETINQNNARLAAGEEVLNFGIALHYGDVVVGNLSSDSCIDYTVIGPNVNLVARLEELTKAPAINDVIGTNGILMSEEFLQGLSKYRALRPLKIKLPELNVTIRSFTEIQNICGLKAEEALGLTENPVEQPLPLLLAS